MKTNVEISEAQRQFLTLLELAKGGDEIIISDGNSPIARLTGITQLNGAHERIAGLHAGDISTTDDFNAPLPDNFWTSEP